MSSPTVRSVGGGALRLLKNAWRGAKFPLIAVIIAFATGGLVVLATGNNPFPVYRELAKGSGLDYLFTWVPGLDVNTEIAKINLISTIVTTTPYILAGLCVAFAFRAGLFNIGGTGQFFAGAVAAFWVASELSGLPGVLLIVLAILAAVASSAIYGAIPGYLKAYRGAHEVISTIMLNWIAIYLGQYLFGLGGPLKGPTENPISIDIPTRAQFPIVWGDIQGVHIGLFIALAAAVAFSLIVRRSTFGYEVRATGFNPEAARAGGINVKHTLVLTMAVSGIFAGLAGAGEVLGIRYHLAANEFSIEQIGFIGIAVALLGRNTAIGCVFAAFLFGALRSGSQQLQGAFDSALAVPLADTVQGIIVLLVSGELALRWLASWRHKQRMAANPPEAAI